MTRHTHAHTGLVTPQLPQLLLTAVLRLFAMLASSLASTLQMISSRDPVIGTQTTPADLPRAKNETQHQETPTAVAQDSPAALILSGYPSRDDGVLAPASTQTVALRPAAIRMTTEIEAHHEHDLPGSVHPMHAFPAKAGIQSSSEISAQRAHNLNP